MVGQVWDRLFGPPRVQDLPDGSVRVRLLGRVFEAPDREILFDAVSRERERLIESLARLHQRAGSRPYALLSRYGSGDLYQRDLQRVESRLSIYNEFLGQLVRQLQRES
jgi:hypothetical protein